MDPLYHSYNQRWDHLLKITTFVLSFVVVILHPYSKVFLTCKNLLFVKANSTTNFAERLHSLPFICTQKLDFCKVSKKVYEFELRVLHSVKYCMSTLSQQICCFGVNGKFLCTSNLSVAIQNKYLPNRLLGSLKQFYKFWEAFGKLVDISFRSSWMLSRNFDVYFACQHLQQT